MNNRRKTQKDRKYTHLHVGGSLDERQVDEKFFLNLEKIVKPWQKTEMIRSIELW